MPWTCENPRLFRRAPSSGRSVTKGRCRILAPAFPLMNKGDAGSVVRVSSEADEWQG